MIVVPVPLNIVVVRAVPTGCLKTEFDSTYPIHLNGIIRQDEFQQSIANINRAVSSRTSLVNALLMLIGLCIVGGFILFVVGGATAVNSGSTGFPPLVGVGFGLVGCGMLVCICGCAILQADRNRRVQEAIAAESLKYSNRSPTPCSWRLDAKTTTWTDQNNDRRASTSYAIIIEIGHSVSSQDAYKYQPSNQPPSYNSQMVGRYCSRCGATDPNPMAKFCSSCGHSLNV